MLKYRKFMTLTNEEMAVITSDLFNPISIDKIIKDKLYNEIRVTMKTKWYSKNDKGEDEEELISDEIIFTEDDISADFEINAKDIELYRKYLFSLGVCDLLKNNPYLNKIITYKGKMVLQKV